MSAIAIIPARGGSSRIKRKNIRLFHGKPIIAYSIEAAQASGIIDRVIVSSEDDEILDVGRQYGAEALKRDPDLARDEVGTQEVTAAALRCMTAVRYACCLYATCPLILPRHILWVYGRMAAPGVSYSCIEGWLYWGRASAFEHEPDLFTSSVWWKPRRRWIDINSENDWLRAERMYAELHNKEGA